MSPSDRQSVRPPAADAAEAVRFAERLALLLSIIAGMVDLTGFYTLGNIFTAHITGNLVLAAAALVRGRPTDPAQLLAVPAFVIALAAVWWIARASGRRNVELARLLLLLQFALLAAALIFCVLTKPSNNPDGPAAGVAVMLAVSAMACQYALLRLSLPVAISTAAMTGNLTNAVLALMAWLSDPESFAPAQKDKLKQSVRLLVGFLLGCVTAAAAVSLIADWAWVFPVSLAAVAVFLR